MIGGVYAILLISQNAEGLRNFYRDALGLPLVDEVHDNVPLHYGCELGEVHFAIHPAPGWPGVQRGDAQSPVIVLRTHDVNGVAARLRNQSVAFVGPYDHGFATAVALRDPDGNQIQVVQPAPAA